MKQTILAGLLTALLAGCGGSGSNVSPVITEPPVTEPPVTVPPPFVGRIGSFIGFESTPTRPIAMSADGKYLYVTNTSNHSLDIFAVDQQGSLTPIDSVTVGLDPVAVALNSSGEVWVVNHVSDSVSVVDVSGVPARVTRTILVGDEPSDIVFARNHAFISTAHRGQQRVNPELNDVPGAGDPQLHEAGIGRADVWVFERSNPGVGIGGKPEKIITMFGDTTRALAVSPDEQSVYAAVFHSGNQTSAVHEAVICPGFEDDVYGEQPCQVMDGISSPQGMEDGWLPGGRTAPGVNADGEYQPWTSMIVKFDQASGEWRDTKGRNFSNGIRFSLPDYDVFGIDSESLTISEQIPHVGTTLFTMATNPVTGDLFVTNTEANNHTRFEGSGDFAESTVQGNLARTRITVIDVDNGNVKPRHLNRHIDYNQLKAPAGTKQHSLSTPGQLSFSQNGKTLFMAAMGSDKVAVIPTQQLTDSRWWDQEGEEFDPTTASEQYIDVSGGPVGLLLNESANRLYVMTRYDNAIAVVAPDTKQVLQRQIMPSPEPESFSAGRFMLYDANRSSSNGESSCASCHISGDTDHLSWNLGNPDASNLRNPQPFPTENFLNLGCLLVGPDEESCALLEILNGNGDERSIAAMKGPMTTQTMRGMSTHGHMHWRGDRSVGYFGEDTAQTLDERTSFKNFIVAFEGLMGLDIHLESVEASEKTADVVALEQDMDKFADFMLRVAMPPNPVRGLDNSLSASAQKGANFFHGERRSDGVETDIAENGDSPDGVNCAGCHGVDHAKGFYGTRGEAAHGGEIQIFKVPQLRNLYTRVGMFGLPDREGFLPSHTREHQGEQIRGFGFLHDGATDLLLNFLKGGVFDNGETGCPQGADERHGCHFNEGAVGIPDEATRQGLVDYMMEFDNDLAPVVGQQITFNQTTAAQVSARLNLLEARAGTPFVSKILGGDVTECDLVATGVIAQKKRGYFYNAAAKQYVADSRDESPLSSEELRELASQDANSLTFTCAVPGLGWQLAVDADLNGVLNGDE